MAPPPGNKSDQDTSNASSARRAIYMRKLIEERKLARGFEKARRSSIRAASEPHEPFSPLSSDPPIDFKLMVDKHPELAGRP